MIGLGIGPFPARLGGPTLVLDFTQGVLPPGLTFTRASTATYIGSDGLLKTAAVDQPRFDYDPITLSCKGLLIEESRTNYFTNSADAGSAWGVKSNITVQSDVETAPNGTGTADAIVENTSSGDHYVERSITLAANQLVTYEAFIKPKGSYRAIWLNLYANGYADSIRAGFNTTTLSVSTTAAGGTGALASANIKAYPNGWYRLRIVGQVSTAVVTDIKLRITFINASTVYTGDGVSGAYVWGADLQPGAFSTSHIPTVASAVTRAADVLTMTGLNFSRWFNPVEGTFVWEIGPSNGTVIGGVGDTFDNTQYATVSGNVIVRSGGVAQAQFVMPSLSAGGRVAWVYKVNDFAASVNGGAAAVDTSGAVPVSSLRLKIGSSPWNVGADAQLNGHIRRIRYYPRRLSNTLLQQLTAAA